MNPIATQQATFDNALVPPKKRLKIERCNARIVFSKPQEKKHIKSPWMLSSYLLTIPHFRLLILNQDFIAPPSEEDLVTFIQELGYSGRCNMLSAIHTDQMHQPWRTFAAIINRYISGKTTGLDRLRESRAQILWALLEVAQLKEATKRSKKDFHISQASSSGYGTDFESGVPDKQQHKTSGTDDNDDDSQDDESNDDDDDNDSDNKDNESKDDDGNFDAGDNERFDSDDDDENPSFTLKDYDEEEYDKEYEFDDDYENMYEEEDDDLYKDVDVRSLGAEHDKERKGDEEMTDADHNTAIPETATAHTITAPPTILMINPLPQLTTPSPEVITLSQLKQVDHSVQFLESIRSQLLTIVDDLLSIRIGYATRTALQLYTKELEKKAQEERKLYIDVVEKSSTIIESLENVVLAKSSPQPQSTYEAAASLTEFELKKILLDKLEKSKSYQAAEDHRNLYDALVECLSPASKEEEPVFETADTEMPQDQGDDMENKRPPTPDPDWNTRKQIDSRPPQTWISQIAKAEKPPLTFDELMSTLIDFSAFVMNHIKIDNLTQQHLVGPTFNLLKGTCKSRVELEYHFEECYKAVTDRLNWTNPEGHQYPFDLSKPLPFIQVQGRQVVPADYFINNDLEYQKGVGSLSRKYTTSTTKTKAAKYDNIE
ncbi:hypothetical protein Tco_0631963 [Tanacetum coccineum]